VNQKKCLLIDALHERGGILAIQRIERTLRDLISGQTFNNCEIKV
jgi:hypothetical protein